jgi:hypothetical protein
MRRRWRPFWLVLCYHQTLKQQELRESFHIRVAESKPKSSPWKFKVRSELDSKIQFDQYVLSVVITMFFEGVQLGFQILPSSQLMRLSYENNL